MLRTEVCGLNYFLLKTGSSLLGAYTQLHVSRIEFFFAHPSKTVFIGNRCY